MRSVPMLKCSSERCVCAPQSLSAGTGTSPRESFSMRMSSEFMTSASACTIGAEVDLAAFFERHVKPLPRLVINKPPSVAGTGGVGSHQNLARTDDETLPSVRHKLQYSRQSNHVLRCRRIMPIERGVRRRLFKEDRCCRAHFVVDNAPSGDMGGSIRSGM